MKLKLTTFMAIALAFSSCGGTDEFKIDSLGVTVGADENREYDITEIWSRRYEIQQPWGRIRMGRKPQEEHQIGNCLGDDLDSL